MTVTRRPSAGFTLVEMLVALAVVGFGALLLSIGVGRMVLDAGRSTRADRRLDEVAAAQFVLRHRLERIVPERDPQTTNTVDFTGQERSVDFVASAPDRLGPDAPHVYRVKLAPDGTLTLYEISALTAAIDTRAQTTTGWRATPLVTGAANLSIAYYGPRPDASGSGWQSSWIRRPTLPVLVRVRAEVDRAARAWPDLVVHLHAANGDVCERDLVTGLCRGAT